MSNPPDETYRDDGRPDPEALLKRYGFYESGTDEVDRSSVPLLPREQPVRGQLRVYLGAAAGVGKTYAMLNEGNRRKARGTDVVIGFVETHRRVQTQEQIGALEIVPRQKIAYRGVQLEEMDTEAIIARRPQVALIDELAHTNVAGSKHPKRYQDVQAILEAGIDVITTLNVQHLESMNDLVASITGVQVRETLPDRILDQADDIELVDIAPDALRQRMKHGNIYSAERIETALHNFFREGNLTALRELALRITAEKTQDQLQQYMTGHDIKEQWATVERVLVGFDARPWSRAILRDAWRLAHGMHAELLAVTIQLTGYRALLHRMGDMLKHGSHLQAYYQEQEQRLHEHVVLAEDLGAEVVQSKGEDIAIALATIARRRQATQIVLGHPTHRQHEVFLYGSVVNRILRLLPGVEIHLVPLHRKSGQ